jgi:predicted peroxiredoxin
MMVDAPELQFIISSGPGDSRATLGFAAATAAAACGTKVIVFLAMEGARWALKSVGNEPQGTGFQAVSQMLALIQSSGGRIEVCSNCLSTACSSCLSEICSMTSDGTRPSEMREGIHPAGLTTVAVRMSQMPSVSF